MIASKADIPTGWSITSTAEPRPVQGEHADKPGAHSEQMIDLARDLYELGLATDRTPFTIRRHGPRIARPLKSEAMEAELARAYFERYGKAASETAIKQTITLAAGFAKDLPPQELHLRFARGPAGEVLIDLGDETGSIVLVDADGWRIEDAPPSVIFRRTALTAPLPHPQQGGNLDELRGLLNVADGSWPLLIGWCIAAMMPDMPRPVLLFTGEQGTGKSSAAAMLVQLIDPGPVPMRQPSAKLEDWLVSANGSAIVGVDNLSTIPDWFSDALCRAVTGDGNVDRLLYTNKDLSVVAFRRAVLLTGIDLAGVRGDLADRMLLVELRRIDATKRRTHAELWKKFDTARPRLFGAILTLLADVLKEIPSVNLAVMPRMADFARVLAAIDQALETSAFSTYLDMTGSLAIDVLESDLIARALAAHLPNMPDGFTGTAADLLGLLPQPSPLPHAWPRNPKALAARLRRIAPALRSVGFTIEVPTDATRTPGTRSRIWRIVAPVDLSNPKGSENEFYEGPGTA